MALTTVRSTGIGSLPAISGANLTSLNASNISSGTLNSARFSGGKILQVLETSYATEVSSTNSSAWTDTGLTLNITPSATSSKILFLISQQGFVTRASSYTRGLFRVLRGSTTVYDSANWTISSQQNGSDISHASMFVFNGLDSPSSTSALTYKTQMLPDSNTTMKAQQSNHPSKIVLMEVA